MDKIIDPLDDLLGPTIAPNVPAPDVAVTGGHIIKDPLKDLLPKPALAPASALVTPAPMPAAPALSAPAPIQDPLNDLLAAKPPTKTLADLFPTPLPTPPPTPEEPGYLGAIGRGLYSGFRRRLPEMAGQTMQFTGLGEETGKGITEWAREGEKRPEFKNVLKDWLYQGAEMVAPSVALPLAIGATGAGVLPASLAAGALFGLSQAQQTKETAEKAGIEPGKVPFITGGIEALGETAGTIALQRLFGPLAPVVSKGGKVAIRDIIKPTFSRMMKEFFGVTIPVEVGTEIVQQVGEAGFEKAAGIRSDADLLREGLSVIGPTFMLSAMTAGMAHPVNRIMSRRFESALSDPSTPDEVRQQTVNSIAQILTEADPNLGAMWQIRGSMAINRKESIPLDEDVSEWFKSGFQLPSEQIPPQHEPQGPPAPITEATPAQPSPTPGPAAPPAPGAVPSPVSPPPAPLAPGIPPGPGVVPAPQPAPAPIPLGEAPKAAGPVPAPAPAAPVEEAERLPVPSARLAPERPPQAPLGPKEPGFPYSPEGKYPLAGERPALVPPIVYHAKTKGDFEGGKISTDIGSDADILGRGFYFGDEAYVSRYGTPEPFELKGNFASNDQWVETLKKYSGKRIEEQRRLAREELKQGGYSGVRGERVGVVWDDAAVGRPEREEKLPEVSPKPPEIPKKEQTAPPKEEPDQGPAPEKKPKPEAMEVVSFEETQIGGDLDDKLFTFYDTMGNKSGWMRFRIKPFTGIVDVDMADFPGGTEAVRKAREVVKDKYPWINEFRNLEIYANNRPYKMLPTQPTVGGASERPPQAPLGPKEPGFPSIPPKEEKKAPTPYAEKVADLRRELEEAKKIPDPLLKQSLQAVEDRIELIEGKLLFGPPSDPTYIESLIREADKSLMPLRKRISAAPPKTTTEKPSIDRQKIWDIYQRLIKESGFNYIEIYDLQKETGIPLEELRKFLLNESGAYRVLLAEGGGRFSGTIGTTHAGMPDERAGYYVDLLDRKMYLVKLEPEFITAKETRAPKPPVSPEGPGLSIGETPAPVKEVQVPKSPTGPLLPEQARRLEEIRKENPEEATRIEKGNVAIGIQQYELARMGKAKQMRQGEMIPVPKAQEKLIPFLGPEFRQKEAVPKYYNPEEKVNLQNEFLEAGRKGLAGAREYFASLGEQKLKAIAEANAQNTNMAREKLLDRMTHYANRAAENIGFGLTGRLEEAYRGPRETEVAGYGLDYVRTFLRNRNIQSASSIAESFMRALQPDFGPKSNYFNNIKDALIKQGIPTQDIDLLVQKVAPITTDWQEAIFKRGQNAHDIIQFLAINSTDETSAGLAKAFLAHPSIIDKAKRIPIVPLMGMIHRAMPNATAFYDPANNNIGLVATHMMQSDNEKNARSLLHEIVHGLVFNNLTPEAKEELNKMFRQAFDLSTGLEFYGLTNENEFIAEAFSNSEFQQYLNQIPGVPGISINEKSLWQRFIDWVNKLLFGKAKEGYLLRQVLELGAKAMVSPEATTGERTEALTRPLYTLSGSAVPDLTHPDFPGNVAEDPKFDPYLGKHRFLIHLTDPDLKRWKEIGVLPYWLAKEYPEFTPFLQSQERREEKRSEIRTEKLKQKEPFTFLRGDSLSRAEAAIVAGDVEGRTWTDAELVDKFNLSPGEIEAYKSVRSTFDDIFQENLDRAELAILENAQKSIDSTFAKLTNKIESHKESEQKNVILGLLKTAHDLILSNDEITSLANLMGETKEAIEKPLKTVRDKMVKIFNEVLTEKDKQKLLADYESAYEKAQIPIGEIREIIHNALGGDIDRANLDEITKGLVWTYIRTERPTNTLKELRAEFGKAKGYFPRDHGRGKYEIFVTQDTFDERGQPQKRVIWNRFFGQFEGTKIYKQMKHDPEFNKAGMEIGIRLHKEEPDSSFWGASLANLQRLTDNSIEELKQKGTISPELAEDIKYQILYELADQFKARGAARHFIHRAHYLIKGYKTTGLNEVINNYISGWAGMITKQDAAGEFLESMKGIPKDKPKLKNYAFKYTENMLRNDENTDHVLGKMRGLIFTYFLGGSLRGGIVNSTQSLTMTIPHLAREVGWKGLRAEGLVLGSAKDIAINRLSQVERRLLDDALDKGALEAQYINEVIREAGDRFGKTLGKIVILLAKPFSFFETKNRQIAALSYFRAKMPDLLKTMTEEEAYQKLLPESIDFVNKTQFMMTKGNLPNWASGADVGSQFFRTAYTFRKFNHNYLLSLRNSFRGPDGKVALDVIGRSLAYVVLLGGLPAIPFLDDLLDEWEKIFGQPVRRQIKRNLSVIGGPALEKMGLMGIPAMVGIDISGSLKMGIPFVGTPSENIFGVWAGLGQKFIRAKDSMERGDVLRAIESASPAFLESILKAYRMTEHGATTPKGKVITDEKGRPIQETTAEGITQAFGFRPERISEASQTHREFANIESHFADRMNDLYARFRLATTADERKKIIRDIQKYNLAASKYRGAIPMINAESLRRSFIQKPEKRYLMWGARS
jgi:uncharacterized protein YaaR (DUF327 family)